MITAKIFAYESIIRVKKLPINLHIISKMCCFFRTIYHIAGIFSNGFIAELRHRAVLCDEALTRPGRACQGLLRAFGPLRIYSVPTSYIGLNSRLYCGERRKNPPVNRQRSTEGLLPRGKGSHGAPVVQAKSLSETNGDARKAVSRRSASYKTASAAMSARKRCWTLPAQEISAESR